MCCFNRSFTIYMSNHRIVTKSLSFLKSFLCKLSFNCQTKTYIRFHLETAENQKIVLPAIVAFAAHLQRCHVLYVTRLSILCDMLLALERF